MTKKNEELGPYRYEATVEKAENGWTIVLRPNRARKTYLVFGEPYWADDCYAEREKYVAKDVAEIADILGKIA